MGDDFGAGGLGDGVTTTSLIVRCRVPDGSDDGRAIDSIGGIDARGRQWHLPLAEAVALARSGLRFVLQGPPPLTHSGPPLYVPLLVAVNERGTAYLRAEAGKGLRLADLPQCTHRYHAPPELDDGPLSRGCREAVEYLRTHCPDVLPTPLAPGEESAPVPLEKKRMSALIQAAAAQSAWRSVGFRGDEQDAPHAVLWRDGPDALLVLLDTVRVDTAEGVVTVSVEVACDELPARGGHRARVWVDLVVGTVERPTGAMLAATPPRGPDVVTQRWADALTAFAWRALIDVSAAMGSTLGHDEDGAALVPSRWFATSGGFSLGVQARHTFDRMGLGMAQARR
ncbi:hypothetical protein [Microbacterium sp. A93]|uniref:hypothetical protein n=1 Tax=unclassified Microbacterium TaxID=2609290 RepID=UPI003F42BE9A